MFCEMLAYMDADKTMRINEGSPGKVITFPAEAMTTSSGSSDDDPSLTSDSLPPLATFSIDECAYRGEGNANVVIALPREHAVIRFRKSLPEEVSPDGGKLRVEREVEFVRNVVSCFLGSYAQIPEILRYDPKDIVRISEAIRTHRPDERRHKEITEVYATKLPDYTFLRGKLDPDLFRNKSTFCVEIKPKQGYLRKCEQRFKKCPYCLMQYYKLKKQVIPTRSTYCPFDLFSGSQARMKAALRGLLKSPQNNLKIFKDGIIVYDAESSSSDLECVIAEWFRNSTATTKEGLLEKFCDLICAALLRPFAQEQPKSYSPLLYNFLVPAQQQDSKSKYCINPDLVAKARKILYFAGEECNLESEGLPKDTVLERILCMQRLPYVNTEYIYNAYSKFSSVLTDEIIYFNLIKSRKPYDYRISHKTTNALTGDGESSKEIYMKAYEKNSSISKQSKYDGNSNGNKRISTESAWFENEEPIEDVSLTPKSSLLPTYYSQHIEESSLYDQKFNMIFNGDDIDYDDQTTNSMISIETIAAMQNYLLFSSARDCSILMAFQELNPNTASSVPYEHVIKLPEELSFLCNIGVSDLDPKSFHCIEKHRQRDIEVLHSVISILEEELAVKNQSSIEKHHSQ